MNRNFYWVWLLGWVLMMVFVIPALAWADHCGGFNDCWKSAPAAAAAAAGAAAVAALFGGGTGNGEGRRAKERPKWDELLAQDAEAQKPQLKGVVEETANAEPPPLATSAPRPHAEPPMPKRATPPSMEIVTPNVSPQPPPQGGEKSPSGTLVPPPQRMRPAPGEMLVTPNLTPQSPPSEPPSPPPVDKTSPRGGEGSQNRPPFKIKVQDNQPRDTSIPDYNKETPSMVPAAHGSIKDPQYGTIALGTIGNWDVGTYDPIKIEYTGNIEYVGGWLEKAPSFDKFGNLVSPGLFHVTKLYLKNDPGNPITVNDILVPINKSGAMQ